MEKLKSSKLLLLSFTVFLIIALFILASNSSAKNAMLSKAPLVSWQKEPVAHGESEMEEEEESEEAKINSNKTDYSISVDNNGFSEKVLNINVFDTVTITNRSDRNIEISADKPSTYGKTPYHSGVMKPGMHSLLAFKKSDTITYKIKENASDQLLISAK